MGLCRICPIPAFCSAHTQRPSAYELVRIRAATQPPNPNVPAAVDIALDRYQVALAVRTLLIQLHHNHSITIVGATPEQVHNLIQVDKRAQEELFDLLVVDEASQIDVADTILPLCAMADGGCLVLAGDDLQLAPIHQAEAPVGLETMVGSVYDFYKKRHGIAPCALNINYRSNQTLVDFGDFCISPEKVYSAFPRAFVVMRIDHQNVEFIAYRETALFMGKGSQKVYNGTRRESVSLSLAHKAILTRSQEKRRRRWLKRSTPFPPTIWTYGPMSSSSACPNSRWLI